MRKIQPWMFRGALVLALGKKATIKRMDEDGNGYVHYIYCVVEGGKHPLPYHPNDVQELVPLLPVVREHAQSIDHIRYFLESLTGFSVKEKVDDGEYTLLLTLGTVNPFVAGFSKEKHPDIPLNIARYLGYVSLLHGMSNVMGDTEALELWLKTEINHIVSSN